MAKSKQPQPKNFEDALGELEKILAEMESGDVPLEESLSRYERGNYLLGFCRQVLGKAEQQIIELSKDRDADGDTPTSSAAGADDGGGEGGESGRDAEDVAV
jgi:exodeoxyribonuclease VII small subunit